MTEPNDALSHRAELLQVEKRILKAVHSSYLKLRKLIMATEKDEIDMLTTLTTEVGAIGDGVAALEAALAKTGTVSPAVQAALDALKAQTDKVQGSLPAPAPAPAPTPVPAPTPAPAAGSRK